MNKNITFGSAEQSDLGRTQGDPSIVNRPRNRGQFVRPGNLPNLPPARKRGCWPTLPDTDANGALSRLRTWPFKLAAKDKFHCEPVCACCGATSIAAASGDFQYWPDGQLSIVEVVDFHVCYDCLIAARSGTAEAEFIRKSLRTLGTWTAAKMERSRLVRSLIKPLAVR